MPERATAREPYLAPIQSCDVFWFFCVCVGQGGQGRDVERFFGRFLFFFSSRRLSCFLFFAPLFSCLSPPACSISSSLSHIVVERAKLVVKLLPRSDDERPRPVVALVDDDDVARGDGPRAVDAAVFSLLLLLLLEGSVASRGRGAVVISNAVGSCDDRASLGAEVDVEDHGSLFALPRRRRRRRKRVSDG